MKRRPAIPSVVLGRPVPDEFRRQRLHFVDPVALLSSFIDWLESGDVAGRADDDRASALAAACDAAVREDRAMLVELCADLHDRLTSDGHREKIRRRLSEAGIELVTADGERFDPQRHEAVGTVSTDDQALDDHVASTQRLGYRDHGRLEREPAVLVYRFDPPGGR